MNNLGFVLKVFMVFIVSVGSGVLLNHALLLPYVKGKKVLYCFLNSSCYVLLFLTLKSFDKIIIYCMMASLLLSISIIDYHFYRIPDKFNFYLLLLGIIYSCIDYKNLAIHLSGFFCVIFFFFLMFFISDNLIMGGGDVKLLAACGLILGWEIIFQGFYLGCVLALLWQILHGCIHKHKTEIAMGPYFTAGILVSIIFL